jgi:NADH-quinone oxidoreductase subunit H
MVSYEVSIGFIIICVIICAGLFNLIEIVLAPKSIWFCVPLLPRFIMFFISALAETNRHPFDLLEAKLVLRYNVEYLAITFALFFY